MSARGRSQRTDGRSRYPCPAEWGRCGRTFRSLSSLHQHLDAAHHTPTPTIRPRTWGGATHAPPLLHSPLAWRMVQSSTTPEQWRRSFESAEAVIPRAPVTTPDHSQETQFRHLAEIYRQWATYASPDDMVGAGLALFPQIPRAYARALALSLKSWIPGRQDDAVSTDSCAYKDATTDVMSPRHPSPYRTDVATTPPRAYRPELINITPPPHLERNSSTTESGVLPIPNPGFEGIIPPPVFANQEPMEVTSSPLKNLGFGGNIGEDSWPEIYDIIRADTTVTDAALCDSLELLAQNL